MSGLSNRTLCMVQVVLEGSVDDPRSSRSLTSKLAVNTVDLSHYHFKIYNQSKYRYQHTHISMQMIIFQRSQILRTIERVIFSLWKSWQNISKSPSTNQIGTWNLIEFRTSGIPEGLLAGHPPSLVENNGGFTTGPRSGWWASGQDNS